MTFSTLDTGHVGLNVTDLARSKRFYAELLGLETEFESTAPGRRFAGLARGGKLLLTLWEQASDAFDGGRAGLHHLSFQVPSVGDVREAERRLAALGVTLLHDGVVRHAEGAASGGIFFLDPDG